MTPTPKRDTSKLPKWAQEHIARLERDLAAAEDKLTAGPEDSNVFADPFRYTRPLGRDTTVRFEVNEGAHFDVRFNGNRLEVYCIDSMLVHPRASNVVHIGAIRRHDLGDIV